MKTIKMSKEEFINQSIQKNGSRFDYSLVDFVKVTDQITVICRQHGEIKTTPRLHLTQKWGCRKCYGHDTSMRQALTTEQFVERATQVHGSKYDYSQTVYRSNSKVSVICAVHGEFWTRPMDHIHSKSGCTKCSGNYKWSTDEFINKAQQIHGNQYDYSQVKYINSSTPINIFCLIHGLFTKTPVGHLQGAGCPSCATERMVKNKIEKGYAIAPEHKEPFRLYRDTVRKLTNQNFRKYYHDINPKNLKRGNDWHLDHIVSIAAGFVNNILPEQIAHPSNLRMISAAENRSKNVYSCDAVSYFDQNNIITRELGDRAHREKRKKHSNIYEITDTHTGEISTVNLLVDWCQQRGYSVSYARWTANYSDGLFKGRYKIRKISSRKSRVKT